jgi:hypothetical protein
MVEEGYEKEALYTSTVTTEQEVADTHNARLLSGEPITSFDLYKLLVDEHVARGRQNIARVIRKFGKPPELTDVYDAAMETHLPPIKGLAFTVGYNRESDDAWLLVPNTYESPYYGIDFVPDATSTIEAMYMIDDHSNPGPGFKCHVQFPIKIGSFEFATYRDLYMSVLRRIETKCRQS